MILKFKFYWNFKIFSDGESMQTKIVVLEEISLNFPVLSFLI
jgi:hypothetical protein